LRVNIGKEKKIQRWENRRFPPAAMLPLWRCSPRGAGPPCGHAPAAPMLPSRQSSLPTRMPAPWRCSPRREAPSAVMIPPPRAGASARGSIDARLQGDRTGRPSMRRVNFFSIFNAGSKLNRVIDVIALDRWYQLGRLSLDPWHTLRIAGKTG
jgi:hypothetical protein